MKQLLFFLLVFVGYNSWAQDFVKIENINGKKYYLYLVEEGVTLESLSTDNGKNFVHIYLTHMCCCFRRLPRPWLHAQYRRQAYRRYVVQLPSTN